MIAGSGEDLFSQINAYFYLIEQVLQLVIYKIGHYLNRARGKGRALWRLLHSALEIPESGYL